MDEISTHFAPGCFGSALTYRTTASECRSCIFAARCKPLHEESLAILRKELGIAEVMERKRRRPAKAPDETAVAPREVSSGDLPKKVARLFERISSTFAGAADAIRAGSNPFDQRMPFMRIAGDMLLSADGLSRGAFVQRLITELNWTYGTASAHATQAVQVLTAMDCVVDRQGVFRPK